ncbi:MAG TPA: right-handed parallel beta-helix repeat-containing protein [Oscillatoriaceae cyanobacterium]
MQAGLAVSLSLLLLGGCQAANPGAPTVGSASQPAATAAFAPQVNAPAASGPREFVVPSNLLTIVASLASNNTSTENKGVDLNLGTSWDSGYHRGAWYGFEIAKDTPLESLLLQSKRGLTFNVDVSSDRNTWTTVLKNQKITSTGVQTFNLPAGTHGQYVLLSFLGTEGYVTEVGVTGGSSSPSTAPSSTPAPSSAPTSTPTPVRTPTPAPVQTPTPAPVQTPTPAPSATPVPVPSSGSQSGPVINADSYSSLQSALNAVPSTGGTVQLSAKTYTIAQTLLVHSNTTLQGTGTSSVIKLASGANCDMLHNSGMSSGKGDSNIHLVNFAMDGNRAAETNNQENMGIYFDYLTNSTIDTVTIQNVVGSACWVRHSSGNTWHNCNFSNNGNDTAFQVSGINLNDYCNNNVISGGTYNDNNNANGLDGNGVRIGDYCESNTVENITANHNGRRGIKVQGSDSKVLNNSLDNNLQQSLLVGGVQCSGNLIQGNTINHSADVALYVSGAAGATTANNTMIGNTILNGQLHGYEIAAGAESCTFKNNTIKDCRGHGMWIRGSSNNVISGNTVQDNSIGWPGHDGIYIANDGTPSNSNQVTGNTVGDTRSGSAKTQAWGVQIDSGSGNVVSGNDLRGNKNGATAIQSGTATVSNNQS